MRVRFAVSGLVAALLAACSPTPVAEEPRPVAVVADRDTEERPLRLGEPQTGVLSEADPVWGQNGRFHLYRFEAREGDRLAIEMSSEEFDSYLVVGDKSGGVFNPIMSDDDSGGDLDARIRFTAPRTGSYWVIAQAYAEYGIGGYMLTLSPLPEPRPAVAVRLETGAAVDGELSMDDAVDDEDGERFFDLYSFEAERGNRYAIELSSSDFDSYLILGRGSAHDFEEIARNDDAGGDYDSRIVFTADESGPYSIRATSFSGGSVGFYTVSVNQVGTPGPLSITPISIGQTISGRLEESDQMNDDGSYYDVYRFQGREGQRISILMRSDEMDSYLELGELGEFENEFYADYTDDDSGGGLDARIIATLDRSGEFMIRANSLYADEVGSYTLTVEEARPSRPADVLPIQIGQTLSGNLDSNDAVLDDGSYYDIYTFSGSRGQRVRITLRSDDFDAYLAVGPWQDGEVQVTDSDDDSGGNLDSQIELTLPQGGTYAIRANSLGAEEVGQYTITVERM